MIERRGVVEQRVVLVRSQDVPGPKFEQVYSLLVNRKPQSFGPIGREVLLQQYIQIEVIIVIQRT